MTVHLLPTKEARAFVLGLWRPHVYLTTGLVSGSSREHLEVVLAHEQAHLRRQDGLRRVVARLGLAFHLPVVDGLIDRHLQRAQEMAADEEAAAAVGSKSSVARALVALSRPGGDEYAAAFAFAAADVEARVMALLDRRRRRNWPSINVLAGSAVIVVASLAASADAVHHGVELLLGALGN